MSGGDARSRSSAVDAELEERMGRLTAENAELRDLLTATGVATMLLDADLRIRCFSAAAEELLGVGVDDIGAPVQSLSPPVSDPQLFADADKVLARHSAIERETVSADGRRWYRRRLAPHQASGAESHGVVLTLTETTASRLQTARLRQRARQQAAVAQLGRRALATPDLHQLFDLACRLLAETLSCEFVKVLQLLPDRRTLLLRAGRGWSDEYPIGEATLSAGIESQGGYALQAGKPVIVKNLPEETRFNGAPMLTQHGVVSGMSVLVGEQENPWGVIGAHSTAAIDFDIDDVNFLQAVSNVLADAIARRQVETALEDSEAAYRAQYAELDTIYQQAPIGLAVFDSELRYRRINQVLAEINGVDIEETIGKKPSDILGDIAATIEQAIRRALETAQPVVIPSFSGEMPSAPDVTRYWDCLYYPFAVDGDAPDRIIAVVQEITERQQAELRLQAEYAVAHKLQQATTFGDSLDAVLDAFARPLGIDVCEYWQRGDDGRLRCVAFRTPNAPSSEDVLQEVFDERTFGIGESLVGLAYESGDFQWFEELACDSRFERGEEADKLGLRSGFAVPILVEGAPQGVLSFFTRQRLDPSAPLLDTFRSIANDIGQAMLRERALAQRSQSEQQLRSIISLAPIPILVHTEAGKVIQANEAFEEANRAALSSHDDLQAAIVDTVATHASARRRLKSATEGGSAEPLQLDTRLASGEVRSWLLYTSNSWTTSRAEEVLTTMAVDVTEAERIEAELEEARDAAEAANQAKSSFLASISHEIRTPMSAILGYAEILEGQLDDRVLLDYTATIRRNGRFLIEILDDILDLSRVEAGKIEINPQTTSPVRLCSEVRSLMQVRAAEYDLPLRFELDGPIPNTIRTDPVRVRQILINLVGNAIKFTREGGVRVSCRCLADRERLRIEVNDTGIGISEDDQERMFEPFAQADGETFNRAGGTGLGLTISRRFAQMLGGNLGVESRLGVGSKFTLEVPTGPLSGVEMHTYDEFPSLTPTPEGALDRARSIEGRVLVVDDQEDIRRLARNVLEAAGAVVDVCVDGSGAVQRIAEAGDDVPDVVVMDMQMPQVDGLEATRRLRSMGYRGAIIALTAAAMRGDRERCLAAGCDDYCSKPLDGAQLIDIVAKQLGPGRRLDGGTTDSGLRVLLVEDDRSSLKALTKWLELEGHEVRPCRTPAAAINAVEDWRPQVALLDIGLGPDDGRSLRQRLASAPGAGDTVFVAVSGRSAVELASLVGKDGFDAYMTKPINSEELRRLLVSASSSDPAASGAE